MYNNKKLKEHLKSATYPLHEWLEESQQFNNLKNNELLEDDYKELLCSLYSLIYPLEQKLKEKKSSFEKEGLNDIDLRLEKTTWLEKDLESLKVKPQNIKPVEFKTLDSFDSLSAALYVIEGSTMGGMQIVKMLNENLPKRYYQGYLQNTMPMWQKFAKWLDETNIDKYEATLAASEVFIILKKLMDR